MLKKYIFLHNYKVITGRMPVWTSDGDELGYPITITPWVELCYKFAIKVRDGELDGNTVEDMILAYSSRAIDLSPLPKTMEVERDGFIISNDRSNREAFVRELPKAQYYNQSTLLDNGPYRKAEVYYLLKNDQVISREIVLDNMNNARRVTQYPKTREKRDAKLFMEASLVFLSYLVEEVGYNSVYRLMPKSETGEYDPCLGEIGIAYGYTPKFSIQDLADGNAKISFYKGTSLSKDDRKALLDIVKVK